MPQSVAGIDNLCAEQFGLLRLRWHNFICDPPTVHFAGVMYESE
jgi:hypothetical protein